MRKNTIPINVPTKSQKTSISYVLVTTTNIQINLKAIPEELDPKL